MRTAFALLFVLSAACGGSSSSTQPDFSSKTDLASTNLDQSAGTGDMAKAVTPTNTPGMVYCYKSTPCTTPGSAPVCCDAEADGGFADTCVASAGACTGTPYACGQAADCGSGQVCCGTTKMSSSGKLEFASTQCETTSCASGDTQLCVAASDCSSGSCVGQEVSGRDVGLCQ